MRKIKTIHRIVRYKRLTIISVIVVLTVQFSPLVFAQTETTQQSQTQSTAKKLETEEERIVRLLITVLKDLPVRMTTLKPEVKRIAFYSFRVDRPDISPTLKKFYRTPLRRN